MKSNINIPQTKKDYRISNALRQYASAQIKERSNNIYSVPIPQAKKNLNNNPTQNYSTPRTPYDNHSFYESKIDKPITKKYTQRSSYTYKQPESKNFREKKIVVPNNNNCNNNIKRKYETTSYEKYSP